MGDIPERRYGYAVPPLSPHDCHWYLSVTAVYVHSLCVRCRPLCCCRCGLVLHFCSCYVTSTSLLMRLASLWSRGFRGSNSLPRAPHAPHISEPLLHQPQRKDHSSQPPYMAGATYPSPTFVAAVAAVVAVVLVVLVVVAVLCAVLWHALALAPSSFKLFNSND